MSIRPRQLKNRAQDTAEPPTVIGIDDWSWRKSQTYVRRDKQDEN
ncbi:hypothetical protein [Falsiroseomonas sp.]|nr:hypothetical protein [Falsiroseomonas sp.]MDP3417270.1 hypothetical protein [Falsiroseomonas sp.]